MITIFFLIVLQRIPKKKKLVKSVSVVYHEHKHLFGDTRLSESTEFSF